MALDHVHLLQVDFQPQHQVASMLDVLGLAWATLAGSPAGTVVVITHPGGTWAMKRTDRLEVIEVPF